jgi:hypothetical protein
MSTPAIVHSLLRPFLHIVVLLQRCIAIITITIAIASVSAPRRNA